MPLPMYQNKNRTNTLIKHTIAVASGKGGVGKSTVAVNLARALQGQGAAVGLMDTDVYGPSIRKMLPEDRMPMQKNGMLQPALCAGIRMISMAYFRDESTATAVRAPIANSIVTQFIQNVAWGQLDYLIIDFPPGTGDIQLTLSQRARLSGAVMVTTPQQIAMLDVRKAINMFVQVRIPVIGVIENMSGLFHPTAKEIIYPFGKGGGVRLAQEIGAPYLGSIPLDPQLSVRSDMGQSIFSEAEKNELSASQSFRSIASKVEAHVKAIDADDANCLQIIDLHWQRLPDSENNDCSIFKDTRAKKKKVALAINKIIQKNNSAFLIEWNDGAVMSYQLSELQKRCPCAQCIENEAVLVDSGVGAKRIVSVGRYALRIEFTKGCSRGIYSFDMLRDDKGS